MSKKHCFSHLVSYDISSPEFLQRLQCEEGQEGESVSLTCQIIGDPCKFSIFIFSYSFGKFEFKCPRLSGSTKTTRS